MITYNVPHTFIPGTKAKANEVNENFAAVLEHINTTNQNSADINFSNLTQSAKEVIYNNSAPGRLIGELVTSSIPITDACLHLLDGSVIEGEGIYKDFVEYIGELYGDGIDAPAYFETEENWQTSISTYGVCGKFVFNPENNTVRLPKITGIIEGTTDISALGSLVSAGLPNITGQFHSTDNAGWANGAFSYQGTTGMGHWNSDDGQHTISFDASKSSAIYGNSTTVQPQTIKQFIYIVIANAKKTDIAINIDNIATDLNSKVDVGAANLTPQGASILAGLAMPSVKYVNLTLGASGAIYTAPANGYIYLQMKLSKSGERFFINALHNSVETYGVLLSQSSTAVALSQILPIRKGDNFNIGYGAYSDYKLRFIYAQGSESEAQ